MPHGGWATALIAASICIGAPLVVLLRAARIVRSPRDSTLPARFLVFRGRVTATGAAAIALLLILTPAYAWLIPFEILAVASAWFWARRRLYEESWGLVAYLSYFLRTTLALRGPWIFLALLPAVVRLYAPTERPEGALIVFGAMLAWFLAYGPILRVVLRARPLTREDLAARFAEITARTQLKPPRVLVVPCRGRWINAFALPGTKLSHVVFTEPLLDAMEPDEVAAIFAHELAHLEHYTAKRLRRAGRAAIVLALLGAIGVPALFKYMGDGGALACWAWAATLLVGLMIRAARHKAHEGESDLRAATLCGDAEPLVRALTRLHTLALLPRQWENDTWVSHPSLVRRIQVLRSASVTPPAGGAGVNVAVRTGPGDWIAFDAERVHWLEGVPAETPADAATLRAAAASARSLQHGELTSLRLDLRRRVPRLVARDRRGRLWTAAIDAQDAATVQAAIDAIDLRLGHAPERRPRRLQSLAVAACLVVSLLLAAVFMLEVEGHRSAALALPLPPRVSAQEPSIPPTRELKLVRPSANVRLSPTGGAYALSVPPAASEDDDEDGGFRSRFMIVSSDGKMGDCEAYDVAFLDETHLLRLVFSSERGWSLSEIDAGGRVVGDWTVELPQLYGPRLAVDPPTRRWSLTGVQYNPPQSLALTGTVGSAGFDTTRINLPAGVRPITTSFGREALGVRLDMGQAFSGIPWRLLLTALTGRPRLRSELWRLDEAGAQRLGEVPTMLQCQPPSRVVAPFVCASHETRGTSLWTVDAARAAVRPLARVPGALIDVEVTDHGVVTLTSSGASLIDVRSARAARLQTRAGQTATRALSYDGGVGILSTDPAARAFSLALYTVP